MHLWTLTVAFGAEPAPTLAAALATSASIGHCPPVGDPADRDSAPPAYGTTWQPVGFSKAGAFAWLAYEGSDALSRWVFVVQSLVNDRTLATVRWDDPEGAHPPVTAFLETKAAAIRAALQTWAVEVRPFPSVSSFPLAADGDRITISIDPTDVPTGQLLVSRMYSEQHGTKTIDRRTARAMEIAGYLQSPFEPRAAVLFAVAEAGFEGTTECRVRVVGANLQTGFQKPIR